MPERPQNRYNKNKIISKRIAKLCLCAGAFVCVCVEVCVSPKCHARRSNQGKLLKMSIPWKSQPKGNYGHLVI